MTFHTPESIYEYNDKLQEDQQTHTKDCITLWGYKDMMVLLQMSSLTFRWHIAKGLYIVMRSRSWILYGSAGISHLWMFWV